MEGAVIFLSIVLSGLVAMIAIDIRQIRKEFMELNRTLKKIQEKPNKTN